MLRLGQKCFLGGHGLILPARLDPYWVWSELQLRRGRLLGEGIRQAPGWGDSSADGFLSLFQTKVVLNGIADPKTLEASSLCLGEYDRQLVTHTLGRSLPETELFDISRPESVAYHTARQRMLSPGEIARLPAGRSLHLRGTCWGLIRSTPWHRTLPWKKIAPLAEQ